MLDTNLPLILIKIPIMMMIIMMVVVILRMVTNRTQMILKINVCVGLGPKKMQGILKITFFSKKESLVSFVGVQI